MIKSLMRVALAGMVFMLTGCSQAATPAAQAPLTEAQKIRQLVGQLSLEEKIGQMMIVGIPGTSADTTALDMVRKYHVGGIIHFDRNLADLEQTQKLNLTLQGQAAESVHPIPLFICVDQEGGAVARMREYLPVAPSAAAIGAQGNPQVAKDWAVRTAEGLQKAGFNVNFAPVADLGFTNNRSYGTEVEQVLPFVKAAVEGYASSNLMCSIKHYPGIGRAMIDPHLDTSRVEASQQELLATDMAPFRTMVQDVPNDNFMIMVSHLVYPAFEAVPSSVSRVLLTDVLRQQWGYKGIIITDDMAMGGLANVYTAEQMGVLAVQAGVDILLSCDGNPAMTYTIYNNVLTAAKNGTIPLERIDASVERILTIKAHRNLLKL